MTEFKEKLLTTKPTVGEMLRSQRLEQHRELRAISDKIRVTVKHLEAVESGMYHKLPSSVYAKHYVKEYAKALGINWRQIEKQFNAEIQHFKNPPPHFTAATTIHHSPLLITKWLKVGAASLVMFLVALYLVGEVVNFLTPPPLKIFSPTPDSIVTEHTITVAGKAAPEALVQINGQTIALSDNGNFSQEVALQKGINTLRITAKSKRSKERVETINILYNDKK